MALEEYQTPSKKAKQNKAKNKEGDTESIRHLALRGGCGMAIVGRVVCVDRMVETR